LASVETPRSGRRVVAERDHRDPFVGLIPGFGIAADVVDTVLSASRFDLLGTGLGLASIVPGLDVATVPLNIGLNRIPRIAKGIESIAGMADKLLPVLNKIQDLLKWILEAGSKLCQQIGQGAKGLYQQARDLIARMAKKGPSGFSVGRFRKLAIFNLGSDSANGARRNH